ncbi:YcgJ family protein [Serratia marcescens]|uniref:YcgJ family protein n=1 Tax=Serratia marcescens TaxID=615 RepID=UPI001F403F11|nr:YcgJ family protein [Serratia marcescens]UIM56144.1 YcgJ family protein [Serratia marcescens]
MSTRQWISRAGWRRGCLFFCVALGVTGAAAAANETALFFPDETPHVVCDATAGFCADAQGISFGLTALYLGAPAQDALLSRLAQAPMGALKRFTLSNGALCDSRLSACFTDASAQQRDVTLTRRLFGE